MEDLQLVFFVLGAIAIVAVLVHGFWSIRKQQPKTMKDNPMGTFYKQQADPNGLLGKSADGFDADGIGAVRVRKLSEQEIEQDFSVTRSYLKNHTKPFLSGDLTATSSELGTETTALDKVPVNDASKVGRQEPILHPEAPVSSSLESESATSASVTETSKDAIMAQSASTATDKTEVTKSVEPQDVLVLHVVAKDGQQLSGAELLPCFLTLNFKYGEMNIFHRHEDNAGNGKTLFSIANMLKPGIFDPDNMEQFTTQGVVFFMTLPANSDALLSFSIMLNSARQLADDIDAVLLDGKRQPWDESAKQGYLQRIRLVA